jgi:hypothetical protein
MRRIIVLLLVSFLFTGAEGSSAGAAGSVKFESGALPDTLVLCPRKFQAALEKWVEYRSSQGHVIKVIVPALSSAGIKKQIRAIAVRGGLKHVLIVGDSGDHRAAPDSLVPTDFVKAQVNVRFGSDPEIATDNTYADLDQDGLPDLTIGRIPCDSSLELKKFTARIIKYESESGAVRPDWQRRINFVAGVGGFGKVIDGLIEQTTKQIITDLVPGGYETKMTYGSWCSPYCPDPRKFSEESIARFNEGCLFWVYIGHGSRHGLDEVYMPDQSYLILDNQTVSKLNCRNGSPIAIFLACYTGATDHPEDCLAETMMQQENGPIAAICGTRVTMPYAMGLLSLEMVHEFFNGDAETLGELAMRAKRRMVEGSQNSPEYRQMIEGMGKTFSPTANLLRLERLEHAQLIHLVGDPLLRLKRPHVIQVEALKTSVAGQQLKVRGSVPADGNLVLELAYERDRLRQRPPRRKVYDSSEASFMGYQATYRSSQNLVCSSKVIPVKAGKFETLISIPHDVVGRCVVRAMLESQASFALGSSKLDVSKAVQIRDAKAPTQSHKK